MLKLRSWSRPLAVSSAKLCMLALLGCNDADNAPADAGPHSDDMSSDSSTAGDANTDTAAYADASVPRDARSPDAAPDATHDPDDARTEEDAEPALDAGSDASDASDAPLCSDDVCCVARTHADDPSRCQDEACMAAGQSLSVYAADDGAHAFWNCDPDVSWISFGDGLAELSVSVDGALCGTTDAAALRAGLRGVTGSAVAVDAHSFADLGAYTGGGADAVKELVLESGRLQLTIEGPVTAMHMTGGLGIYTCNGSGTLPVGICNCTFTGPGPSVRIHYDIPLSTH